jgi:hypothetical protein
VIEHQIADDEHATAAGARQDRCKIRRGHDRRATAATLPRTAA